MNSIISSFFKILQDSVNLKFTFPISNLANRIDNTHREHAPSNKTQELTKVMNVQLGNLYIKSITYERFYTQIKLSKKVVRSNNPYPVPCDKSIL